VRLVHTHNHKETREIIMGNGNATNIFSCFLVDVSLFHVGSTWTSHVTIFISKPMISGDKNMHSSSGHLELSTNFIAFKIKKKEKKKKKKGGVLSFLHPPLFSCLIN
jgi:hypothetical protein